jgi:predicted ester cyclase
MSGIMDPINTFYKVYNEGTYELWNDALAENYTAEVNGHTIPNRDVGLGFVKTFRNAFPDLFYTVDEAIVAGDKVTTRWTATGTHQASSSATPPPTSRSPCSASPSSRSRAARSPSCGTCGTWPGC